MRATSSCAASSQRPCTERLKAELPELEERVVGEEASYTFDWYDDHHYEKVFSGRLKACHVLLELYER